MHRRVDEDQLGIGPDQAVDGRLPPMRRAVVDDPEDPLSGLIPPGFHHLSHQATKGLDAGLRLAPAHHIALTDIPGGQVPQCSTLVVLMLDPQRTPGSGSQGGMAANSSLNARLLVGADDVILRDQGLAFPDPRVKVQNPPGLFGEAWITREDPVLVSPGLDRSVVENPPDRAAADRLAQGMLGSDRQVVQRLTAQGSLGQVNQLASGGFDQGPIQKGKRRTLRPRPGSSSNVNRPSAQRRRQARTESR